MKQKKIQNGRLRKFKMAASKKPHFPAPPILNISSIYVRSVFKKYTLFFFYLLIASLLAINTKQLKKIGTYSIFQTQQPTCGFRNFTNGMTAKPTGSQMFTCELTQCPTMKLNKRSLPKPTTTTGWKLIPHRSKISMNWNPLHWDPIIPYNCQK